LLLPFSSPHREREKEGRGGGRYGEYSIFSSFADSPGANLGESDGAACLFTRICVVQDTDVSTSCCDRVSVIDTAPSANIALRQDICHSQSSTYPRRLAGVGFTY
jgi:hypothetical protein